MSFLIRKIKKATARRGLAVEIIATVSFVFVSFLLLATVSYAQTSTASVRQTRSLSAAQIQAQKTKSPKPSGRSFVCTRLSSDLASSVSDLGRAGAVTSLQKFLSSRGYFWNPAETGIFGTSTKKAVEAFQRASGITYKSTSKSAGYGVVDSVTRTKIADRSCGRSSNATR